MALLFVDSFDHYTGTHIADKYNTAISGATIAPAYARHGIGGMRQAGMISKTFPNQTTAMMGAAIRPTLIGDRLPIFSLRSVLGGSYAHASLVMMQTGQLGVYCNWLSLTFSTPSGLTVPPYLLQEGVWAYIEMKVTAIGASSTITVRMNEQVALTCTGDTRITGSATEWNKFDLGPCASNWDIDDLYVGSLSGGEYTDFLGEVRIDAHYPTGPGTYAQWARVGADSGANWDQVNEVTPNDDTDANESDTAGQIDTFGCTDFVPEGNALVAVQHVYAAKKTDAGPSTSTSIIRLGTTDYEGDTNAPGQDTYAYFLKMYETAPDASAWDEATFESMEVGYKRLT